MIQPYEYPVELVCITDKIVNIGSTLTGLWGYVWKVNDIDCTGRTANVILFKDGINIESRFMVAGDIWKQPNPFNAQELQSFNVKSIFCATESKFVYVDSCQWTQQTTILIKIGTWPVSLTDGMVYTITGNIKKSISLSPISTEQIHITENRINYVSGNTNTNGDFSLTFTAHAGKEYAFYYPGTIAVTGIESSIGKIIDYSHVIKVQLIQYDYIGYLIENIGKISTEIAGKIVSINPNPNIKYLRTEYNSRDNTLDIYILYTGTELSVPYYTKPYVATVPGEIEITDWFKILLPVIAGVVAGVIFVAIVTRTLGVGWPVAAVVAVGTLALAVLIYDGFYIIHIGTQLVSAKTAMTNVLQHNTQKDVYQSEKDKLLELCSNNTITTIEFIDGLKEAAVTYANKKKIDFPLIDIKMELDNYITCADNVKSSYSTSDDCASILVKMNSCDSPLLSKIDLEIATKYGPGPYVPPACSNNYTEDSCILSGRCMWYYDTCVSKVSCIVKNPLDNRSCLLSTEDIIKGLPLIAGSSALIVLTILYGPMVLNGITTTLGLIQDNKKH